MGDGGEKWVLWLFFVARGLWAQPNGACSCLSLGAASPKGEDIFSSLVIRQWKNSVLLKSTHFTGVFPVENITTPLIHYSDAFIEGW